MTPSLLIFLRGVDIGLAAVLLAVAAAMPRRLRLALVPLVVCLVSYLLRSAPEAVAAPWPVLLVPSIGALLFPVAFWWLLHNVFDDRTDVPWPAGVLAVVLVAAGLMPPAPGAAVVQKVLAAGFVGAALWRLALSSADDLVAARRSLRVWLLGYVGTHGLAVLSVELWLMNTAAPTWLDAVNLGAIGLAQAVTLAFTVRPHGQALDILFGARSLRSIEVTPTPVMPDSKAEDVWLERLQLLMTTENAYRDPELSVGGLADRLRLPEYKLRDLINKRLGYRNFSAFVNEHRVREVAQKLEDPAFDGRPILSLALDAGFGSIGPFNRAFRDRHGVTPSAYRAAGRLAAAERHEGQEAPG
jgi:AraC-like DNA-binding protein